MLTHPHVLELLINWKLSDNQDIPKELLVLLVHNNNKISNDELCEILYKYKKKKQKREINLENIKTSIESWFDIVEGCYKLRNTDGLSAKTLKLIEKHSASHPKIDYVKNFYENIDNLVFYNPELVTKLIYKLIYRVKETDINMKKFVNNIENIFKTSDSKYIPKKLFTPRDSLTDTSILNYVTKRERLSIQQNSRFIPLQFDDSVYVYNLKNPNYVSFRRRKELINPVKKIFIKLASDFRPPIYKISELRLQNRNSLKKILNVDYDEDSTWDDQDEGEDIVSEESDNEEEISGDEEWVEEDSDEQDIIKPQKRPILVFPNIKTVKNVEYAEFWNRLPLEKGDEVSEEFKNYIKDHDERNIKVLSNRFMIKENVLKDLLNKENDIKGIIE